MHRMKTCFKTKQSAIKGRFLKPINIRVSLYSTLTAHVFEWRVMLDPISSYTLAYLRRQKPVLQIYSFACVSWTA